MFKLEAKFGLVVVMVLACTGNVAIADAPTAPLYLDFSMAQSTMAYGDDHEAADLLDKLSLSPSQKEQIQRIRDEYQRQMRMQRAAVQGAKEIMRDLIRDSTTPRSQLEAQHRMVSALRQELANLHFQQMLDIREVLTPAQRAELAQHMAQKHRGDRLQKRWQNWFSWRR
ncbi:periplasmic heavy metal sensor [Synechococcus moorigangaii CMS01]|nr:periplasmic heavy metal sensor [Synechococcus moorigangaii CMS01]